MFYKTRRAIRKFKDMRDNPFGTLSYDGRTEAYMKAVNDYLGMAPKGDYVSEFIKKVTPSTHPDGERSAGTLSIRDGKVEDRPRQLNEEIAMQLDPRIEFLDKGFRNEKADRVEQLSKAHFGLAQVMAFKLVSGRLDPAAENTTWKQIRSMTVVTPSEKEGGEHVRMGKFNENEPGVPKNPVSSLKKWLDGVAEDVMRAHVYDAYRDLGASELKAEAMVAQDIKQLRTSLAQLRKQYDNERMITDLSRWTDRVDDTAKTSQSQHGVS